MNRHDDFLSFHAASQPERIAAIEAATELELRYRHMAGTIFGMSLEPDLIRAHAGSVGIPTPRVHARIVDDEGTTLPVGEAGELQIRGGNVFSGYWRNPQATAEAFTADGWFGSGDVVKARSRRTCCVRHCRSRAMDRSELGAIDVHTRAEVSCRQAHNPENATCRHPL